MQFKENQKKTVKGYGPFCLSELFYLVCTLAAKVLFDFELLARTTCATSSKHNIYRSRLNVVSVL